MSRRSAPHEAGRGAALLMAQFLLEFMSEEVPARMQANAARDLARMATERLDTAGLVYDRARTFAGPRRLTLVVDGLPTRQPERREERKGPRTGAPEAAVAGFLRSTGLSREALIERGGVFFGEVVSLGRATRDVVAEAALEIATIFPWPKSMRSGASAFRWVRPLTSVLCLFDGEIVSLVLDGLMAGRSTRGHRFMGSCGAPFEVESFDDYVRALAEQRVLVDAERRREVILERSRALCSLRGLELIEDEALIGELVGLAEWPTPVLGEMNSSFLDLPPEVIRTSMRTHQKYLAVRRPDGGLAPNFVVVANVETTDDGAGLARGNARVLSARLADARFFWDADRRPDAFERWAEALRGVTFHAKLGSMTQRIDRIVALAQELAEAVGFEGDLGSIVIAARLCKLDLASQMVGEFPELQGVMGGYYARLDLHRGSTIDLSTSSPPDGNEDPLSELGVLAPSTAVEATAWSQGLSRRDIDRIADAVRDHYKPAGPSDGTPTDPVTVIVALADKLDTLASFFAIGERPTGSRDPYALRRAALGVIRLILDNRLRLGLRRVLPAANADELLAFFADRLKIAMREAGERHDLVDAVFALGDDDLVRMRSRLSALSAFLQTQDGVNLLAGYRRGANILRAESRKQGDAPPLGAPDEALMHDPLERDLAQSVRTALDDLNVALQHERFVAAMTCLARLRRPVDAFFDGVRVNDPDPLVRMNRLRILSEMEKAALRVADFSLIAG